MDVCARQAEAEQEAETQVKRTPLRPGTKPLVRRKPLTGKQRAFLRHKNDERVRAHWEEHAALKAGKKPKLQPIKAITDRAWAAFSKYVRLRDCYGSPTTACCFTCTKQADWREMHAGHFVHAGRRNPVSYDERNINAQCPACNTFLHGNLAMYAVRLIAKHGAGVDNELRAMKAQSKALSRTALHEIATKYEKLVQEMLRGRDSQANTALPAIENGVRETGGWPPASD